MFIIFLAKIAISYASTQVRKYYWSLVSDSSNSCTRVLETSLAFSEWFAINGAAGVL